jgi:hypothetical protein
MVARITDWSLVDWTKRNTDIARETGAAITTVIKRRTKMGHPAAPGGWTRPDNALRNGLPHRREQQRALQPRLTELARASPKAGRGITNVQAVDWTLMGPDDRLHRVHNLYQFVRDNPGLFMADDVVWKRTGGKRGTGGEYCNATAGILNIKGGKAKSWKGWRLLPAEKQADE